MERPAGEAPIIPVSIGRRSIGPDAPVFIIAEAGVNANGDVVLARRLIDAAADAGVDGVKFQTFRAEDVAGPSAAKAAYQLAGSSPAESQQEMLKRLELSPRAHREVQAHCESRGVLFLSTPFSEESADLLDELGVPAFKISSGDITNIPLLQHVARKGKPVILSTGMSTLEEVHEAVSSVRLAGCDQLILLHCVSMYPAEPADVNLRAILTLARVFRVPVGYSDHTLGINVALAAVALGACVIEKHVTLDRSLAGPDHRVSLEPAELVALVAGIRATQLALGHGVKRPAEGELGNRLAARRSLAAAVDLAQGSVLTLAVMKALRPATGIPPALSPQVVGRRLKRPRGAGEPIRWDDLE